MKFFTAGDVLQHAKATPTDPVTVRKGTTINEALTIMLENDFDQLPVTSEDGSEIVGAVTFKSIGRLGEAVPDQDLEELSVMGTLVSPTYVGREHNMFELFETFAVEEFVLVGDRNDMEGIITRYDVFYFLKEQFAPFIMIGEIERSLRRLFETTIPNLEGSIEEAFKPRAEDDPSYSVPESIDHFNFEEYKRFMVVNQDYLPDSLQRELDFALNLLEGVRKNRNALFHFRAEIDDIDREIIEVAHSYFTSLVDGAENNISSHQNG